MSIELRMKNQGIFLVRTPLLPLSTLQQWTAAESSHAFIRTAYENRRLSDALYIASPTLHDRLTELHNKMAGQSMQESPAPAADGLQLYDALSKYLARAAFRSTPFGLFACVTPGCIDNQTSFTAIDTAMPQVRIRYDFGVQAAFSNHLTGSKEVRRRLAYRVNSSLSRHGKHVYYIEGSDQQGRKKYQLTKVARDAHLDVLLEQASRYTAYADLHASLCLHANVTTDTADDYLDELINSEILLPDLGVTITTTDSFSLFVEKLRAISEYPKIELADHVLNQLKANAADASLANGFESAHRTLSEETPFAVERKNLFQVDAMRKAPATMSTELSSTIAQVVGLTARLTAHRTTMLDDFKRRFSERFEQREVGLDILFNEELGLSFRQKGRSVSSLLDGIEISRSGNVSEQVPWSLFDKLMCKKLHESLSSGSTEIKISEQDIKSLPDGDWQLLDGRGVAAQLTLFGGDGDVPQIFLQSLTGRTGVETFGRFCDMDEQLTEAVRSILARQPDTEDIIYAEIVHAPQDRLLNIAARPSLSRYEIEFLGKSGAAEEFRLTLSDLLLSVRNGLFELRSRRLGKKVVPRLSSAHNFLGHNLDAYQFLCSLTQQESATIGFDWSAVFADCRTLPRVTIEGTIISPAIWRLDQTDLQSLRTALVSGCVAVQKWQTERGLPRYLTFGPGDNLLPIDFDNESLVRVFLEETADWQRVDVKEAPALSHVAQYAGMSAHNVEMYMPFKAEVLKPKVPASLPHASVAIAASREQPLAEPYMYLPGSIWVYYKLYCGHSQADEIIHHYLAPALRELQWDGLVSKWFFIRYDDPDHHIRVRVLAPVQAGQLAVQSKLSAIVRTGLEDGILQKVLIGTYEREVARYGGLSAMAACESLFHTDSELIADLLASSEDTVSTIDRWAFAALYVQMLFAVSGLDAIRQHNIIRQGTEQFRAEFHLGARQKVQIGAKYRSLRPILDSVILRRPHVLHADYEMLRERWQAILHRHRPQLLAGATQLRELEERGQLGADLELIYQSLIHMHCNRLFISDARAHEAIFYDFMGRIQGSVAAANASLHHSRPVQ
ncbi:lantibiotic dehydratase [Massilia sp. MB5]|uniref:lantibiotic dehydratase n=1 Tax=Massilia sp. MB5 TaxID=2919578 RepID=UPI001F0DB3AA|nr:lantibiotic dehydratase [Massilia sp. MB5]UMR29231.1 lantibiotic dehydratase [Massilia sp. MB5]